MPSNADNVILTFPPRPVSDWELSVVTEWFVATQREGLGIAQAFVSERRGDDPMLVGRIVIVERPAKVATHVIYSPAGSTFWVVASARSLGDLQRFHSLRAALNSIRAVFDDPDARSAEDIAASIVW
jgi:hypothetical protein